MAGKYWIKGAIKRPGALHRALRVPRRKKIPKSKLKVKKSDTTRMKRMKNLARTLARFHRGR